MPTKDGGELLTERVLRYLENAEQARAQARASNNEPQKKLYQLIATSWERMAESYDWFTKI